MWSGAVMEVEAGGEVPHPAPFLSFFYIERVMKSLQQPAWIHSSCSHESLPAAKSSRAGVMSSEGSISLHALQQRALRSSVGSLWSMSLLHICSIKSSEVILCFFIFPSSASFPPSLFLCRDSTPVPFY